jgi:hypothetical protein
MAKGAVRRGVQEKRFKSGEQWEVLHREEGAVIVGKDSVEKQLPLEQTRKFSVFTRESIALSIGDRIRFTNNVKHRGQKFLNNELRTVISIDEDKIIFDKGEIVRNGALCISTREKLSRVTPARRKLSTKSLSACRFGRSARRTRHNFMSRCRARDGRCTSLLIAR